MKGYHVGNIVEAVKLAREGAAVRRVHTMQVIGEYNVGHHSFNMLSLLRILFPEPPIELVWAIVEHDIPERLIGDIPAPAKWFKIVNSQHMAEMEREINEMIFGEAYEHQLNEEGLRWLRGLDILELYLWCKDQMMLGNSNLGVMHGRIEKFIEGNVHRFAEDVIDFYHHVKNYDWTMMPDLGDVE